MIALVLEVVLGICAVVVVVIAASMCSRWWARALVALGAVALLGGLAVAFSTAAARCADQGGTWRTVIAGKAPIAWCDR